MALKFEPISKTKKDKNKQPFKKFIEKYDKWYEQASDEDTQTEILNKACKEFVINYNEPMQKDNFTDFFKEKHGIKKSVMYEILDKYHKQNLSEDTTKVMPEITRVEKFLDKHFDMYYDEMSNKYFYKKKNSVKYDELNVYNLDRFMRKRYMNYGKGKLIDLIKSDYVRKYNPIESYFRNLPAWDGTDHISNLSSYIILQEENHDRERFNRHMKKMLVRTIASGLSIDFNKRCIIFIGGQDAGKSTFQRWLCPPKLQNYCAENIDFSNKDGLRALADNFWIILDDMGKLPKDHINTVKSVMSRNQIKIRLPYDANDTIMPRRGNFIGNGNEDEFLSDPTGNVRWICFRIQDINWNYMKDININKVWSQAYHIFKKGDFKYDLTREELRENEKVNATFKVQTEEMLYLQEYFISHPPLKYTNNEKYYEKNAYYKTSTQVAEELANKTLTKKRFNPVMVGKALANLGFERKTMRNENQIPTKYWILFEKK
jgi:hypothetical protein